MNKTRKMIQGVKESIAIGRFFRLIVISLYTLNLFSPEAIAQKYKYTIGLEAGTTFYSGDLARKGIIAPHHLSTAVVGRYKHNFRWEFASSLSYQSLSSEWNYAENIFPQGNKDLNFSAHLCNLNLISEFNFYPFSNKFRYLETSSFTPYLLFGAGMSFAWKDKKYTFAPNTLLGFGLKYMFSQRFQMNLSAEYNYTFTDKLDALSQDSEFLEQPFNNKPDFLKGNDAFITIRLGFAYSFGLRCDTNCARMNVSNK